MSPVPVCSPGPAPEEPTAPARPERKGRVWGLHENDSLARSQHGLRRKESTKLPLCSNYNNVSFFRNSRLTQGFPGSTSSRSSLGKGRGRHQWTWNRMRSHCPSAPVREGITAAGPASWAAQRGSTTVCVVTVHPGGSQLPCYPPQALAQAHSALPWDARTTACSEKGAQQCVFVHLCVRACVFFHCFECNCMRLS